MNAPLAADPALSATPEIAILGAGVAGLCMAIYLKRAGIERFTIYEKAPRLGGTWRDNTYPGCSCDVPSQLYSFSFALKADWSRKFAEQPEIDAYLEDCADRFDVRRHIRFGTEITDARFDETTGRWTLKTGAEGSVTADIVIAGLGQLNRPRTPALPGLDSFAGTAFHSARWNHAHDLKGRRVAVIGNGASAIQFIPRIAPDVADLTVFQRTANWIVPRFDRAYAPWEIALFRHVPFWKWLYRTQFFLRMENRFRAFFPGTRMSRLFEGAAVAYMKSLVKDEALRQKLIPDYPIGCKRILVSDDYYQALSRPHVHVETAPIARIVPDGVETADGRLHQADTLILATGFDATGFLAPVEITGAGGQRLADAWRKGAEAHLGVTVAGFPNLFLLYGPGTNLGHTSIIFMIEAQARYVLQCLRLMINRELASLSVKPEAMARSNRQLADDIKKTAWAGGCSSWYKTADGRVTNNWGRFASSYWWRMRTPDVEDFEQVPRRG